MENFHLIEQKLEAFIRKYYLNELLRGLIAFVSIGLAYFLLTLSFEYFFWLGTIMRSILFWFFIGVEAALFLRLIVLPLTRLLKLSRGIDYFQASEIIGKHFPEVDDKLLNILQLKQDRAGSDLILASIDQKSKELRPVPFSIAVDFKSNLKYLKYAAIPLVVALVIYISGNASFFSDSYSRVVNYDREYTPPAPFQFQVLNSSLKAQEDQNFTLRVQTEGNVVPSEAKITYNGETYFLEQIQPGLFRHKFDRRDSDLEFKLEANSVTSPKYRLKVIKVPSLIDFQMELDYPDYTGKENESIRGTGNASVPVGTTIHWVIQAQNTDEVNIKWPDTTQMMHKENEIFTWNRQMMKTEPYSLSTSNANLQQYETLDYKINLIPDENSEIEIEKKTDSTDAQTQYFFGRLSDDYGLQKLEIVYSAQNSDAPAQRQNITIQHGNFDEFLYSFPGELNLKPGVGYEFYFRVWDNDKVHGTKASRSQSFYYHNLSEREKQEKNLQNQQKAIEGMDKSLKDMRQSEKEWKDLEQLRKEKKELNYNDKRKLKQFIQDQQRQQQKMQEYSEKMKKNLEKFKSDQQDPERKQQLEERLERSREQSEKNKKLLDEMKKYQDKIDKEKLNKDLDEVKKQSESQRKNLEQMLELTKRFYVEEKARKLNEDLQELAEEQDSLSQNKENNTAKEQEKLNEDFKKFRQELDSLEQENDQLKSPMDLKRDAKKEESAAQDQQEATQQLKKNAAEKTKGEGERDSKKGAENKDEQNKTEQPGKQNNSKKSGAQKKQQSAAEKMKQMAQQMQMSMQQSQIQQQTEDAEMLRQVLDNLVTFSFQQEDLMEEFRELSSKSSEFPQKLRYQNTLRENFEHIDDSLYALATRNPMISEKVNKELTDIKFNIDKALDRLAQSEMKKGISNQQYAFKGANDLANMLDESLQNMQAMMNASSSGQGQGSKGKQGKKGKGQGRGFQLPDIIKKQGELSEKNGGKKSGQKPGKSGKSGQSSGGKSGKSGENNRQGQQGKNGQSKADGSEGKGEKLGKKGASGSNGQGQNEQMSGQVYEIYKQQQRLRMQLENMLNKSGLKEKQRRLLQDMEDVEQNLLQYGMTQKTKDQMLHVKEQLMKLDQASMKQGKKNERQATTNREQYQNEVQDDIEKAKDYFNTTEILNRKKLPLRQQYRLKVEHYFHNKND